MKKLLSFIRNSKGVATVEFALTIGIFLVALFAIFELARIALLSAYMDLAVSHAVKTTKNTKIVLNSDYEDEFKKNLQQIILDLQKQNQGWRILEMSEKEAISFEVKYAESVSDLINDRFKETLDSNKQKIKDAGQNVALAKYAFTYQYSPMFFWFPQTLSKPIFYRELVVLQEYERTEHKIR